MSTYDKHYEQPQYFGEPYQELLSFFLKYQPKGIVLDLGCGQGRDAIALARMGYKVIGVDKSKVGVSQMMSIVQEENLDIQGIVGNIYGYTIEKGIDIVLLDSMFHFYKRDKAEEVEFLQRIMHELRVGGLICIVIWKSKSIEANLMKVLNSFADSWVSIYDEYIGYPEGNMEMRMIVWKKNYE